MKDSWETDIDAPEQCLRGIFEFIKIMLGFYPKTLSKIVSEAFNFLFFDCFAKNNDREKLSKVMG